MTSSEPFVVINVCESNETYSLIEEVPHDQNTSPLARLSNEELSKATSNDNEIYINNDAQKLNSAIWTTQSTSTLLKLYEDKLEMLETPKKKTRIWIAISEHLKDIDIDVTPDQVRWKINALTNKYKRCIDMGKHEKFKYFKEMDSIYSKYNVDCDSYTITEFLSKKKNHELPIDFTSRKVPETRAMIDMRKARLASRIDSDRFQGKIKLERQWLEYLHRKEEQKQWRDKLFERNLKLKEQKLETKKKELEVKESLEYKKLQLMEKEIDDTIQIEREKCDLLKQLFCQSF